MSIDGINNSGGVTFQGLANPYALTADALLVYCQTQLNDIDGQIKGYLDQQKVALQKKEILNELKATLSKYQPPKQENAGEIAGAYMTAYNRLNDLGATDLATAIKADATKLFPDLDKQYELNGQKGSGFELGAALWSSAGGGMWGINQQALMKAMSPTWPKAPSKESWSGYVGDVSAKLDDISGDAELNMIQLQSLMSKRQTAIQLTTNMMAKHDQGLSAIVANMKG